MGPLWNRLTGSPTKAKPVPVDLAAERLEKTEAATEEILVSHLRYL